MSNRRNTARSLAHRLLGWLVSPDGAAAAAAAAAANGEPAPLLALTGHQR
jgi:hypothetical protein